MLDAAWRQYDRLGTELLLFGTDPERAAALQHYVNFVRVLVRMDSLPLTRLQTIHVAKQLVGLAQIDLGHSLAGESHCLSDVLKNHRLGLLVFRSAFFSIIPCGELAFNALYTPSGVLPPSLAQRSK